METLQPPEGIMSILVPTLCVGTHVFRRSASVGGGDDAERRKQCVPTEDRGNEK